MHGNRELGCAGSPPKDVTQPKRIDPVRLPIRVDAEVLENGSAGGDGRRMVLGVEGWPGSLPGQFVMLSAGARTDVERSDPLLPRPMAVYRVREESGVARVEILYKVVGRGTALLAETLPGQVIRLVGPLGRPFPEIDERSGRPILVGGGTGIASLYELAERAAQKLTDASRVAVVLGGRSADDLLGREDFAALGVSLYLATEDGSTGSRGLVTGPLSELLAGESQAVVYACGPTPMMQRCAELAAEGGAECIVSLENNMACGFGVCLGCAAPLAAGGIALVCRDGPVMDATTIAWEGLA
jgi:dihydroorotate dehydrogenase electron transfer subunit